MESKPDIIRANDKISDAKSWRGTVNVDIDGETITFAHRLLNENEYLRLKKSLDMDAARDEAGNVGQTDAQERLLELQQKEELTDEEEQELQKLTEQVAGQTGEIEDALGDEGYELITEIGRDAIEPSDEDVEYMYNNELEFQQFAGLEQLPNPFTKDEVRDILREKYRDMVADQPYPIKLNVGMQALGETISVLGNGLRR